jgi:hypothetical protein
MTVIPKVCSIVILLALVASSLIIAPILAVTKPAIPEITVTYTDNSYDVPSSTSVDSFSGEITQHPGYHVHNGSVQISIKNQQYNSYYDSNGHLIKLYYHIRMKDHAATEWHYTDDPTTKYFSAHDTEYTSWYYPVTNNRIGYTWDGITTQSGMADFEVEAFIGYSTKVITNPNDIVLRPDDYHYDFTGEISGWSSTQTITIGSSITQSTPTASPNQPTLNPTTTVSPTQTPTVTTIPQDSQQPQTDLLAGLNWEKVAIVGLTVAVAVLAVGMVVMWRKMAGTKS